MSSMSSVSPKQAADFEKETNYRDATERRFARERFSRDFLEFTGRIAYGKAGSGSSRRSGMYYERHGLSNVVPIETEPGSPQMAALVLGYFSEFEKRRFRKTRTIIREVVGAEVKVGVLSADKSFGAMLAGAETVLQVFNHPPTVLFRHSEGPLAVIDAESEAWADMEQLVKELSEHEEELANGQAVPVGWQVDR